MIASSALTVCAEEGTGFLWDLRTGNITGRFQGCSATAAGLATSGSGAFVAALPDQPKAMGWSWANESPAMRSVLPEKMRSLATTSDGLFIVGGGQSGHLYAWEAGSGRLLAGFGAHYGGVLCIAITTDDQMVVTGGDDAIVHTWTIGELLTAGTTAPASRGSWTDHSLAVTSIQCAGSSTSHIATASRDQTVKLWQAQQAPHCVLSVSLPTPLLSLAFDPSERCLVAGGEDGVLYHMELLAVGESHEIYHQLTGHLAPVLSLSMTFDGTIVLSSSADKTARVWDLASGQQILSFTLHNGPVTACKIMNSLELMATVGPMGSLHRRIAQADDTEMHVDTGSIKGVQLSSAGHQMFEQSGAVMAADPANGSELNTLQAELAAQRAQTAHWQGVAQGLEKQAMDLCTASLK